MKTVACYHENSCMLSLFWIGCESTYSVSPSFRPSKDKLVLNLYFLVDNNKSCCKLYYSMKQHHPIQTGIYKQT